MLFTHCHSFRSFFFVIEMCENSNVSYFSVWLSQLVDIERISQKIDSRFPLVAVQSCFLFVRMRKVYMHRLVWITLTVDQLMYWWKETWRLSRGWVTWIGLHPSSGLLCFFSPLSNTPGCWICGCLTSVWYISRFVPLSLFHWMLRTLAVFLFFWQPKLWLDCQTWCIKQHGHQPAGERNSAIVEAQRDAVHITTGWVRAPEVEQFPLIIYGLTLIWCISAI